jgi:hypothetical protein
MPYPAVNLTRPLEVQPPITSSTIEVLNVVENPQEKTVQAFVNYGAGSEWVSIMTPATYISNWSDEDIASAVQAWAETNFSPAR